MSSIRKAIDEKCKDCNYDDMDVGSWREQIESCTDEKCSLHQFRPITIANGTVASNRQDNVCYQE